MDIRWVSVGTGRVALSHRPKLKDIAKLPEQGCQRMVTIQGPHESPSQIEKAVRQAALTWTWIAVGDGKFPEGEAHRLLSQGVKEVAAAVQAGESVLIHCSAGIHRTGMFAFALLRWLEFSETEALEKIAEMRPHTREGMHADHIAWGNQLVQEAGRS
jgi:protein tyrosine phosphatase (PTP) superfamily phosphohydrolase (DUF442 family)